MMREIQSYFVKDSARWTRSYNRLLDRWTDEVIVNEPAVTGGIYLGMPITVLISEWTFSAAEGLAYALQNGRKAVVVGRPSAGGAHTLRRVGLGHGFVAYIPYIRPVNVFTNSNWEGTGVTPDIAADAPRAVLTAAELILTKRANAATDSASRRAAEFALNAARAAEHDVDVPVGTLEKYVGKFEEYSFVLVGNRLYSTNESRNGRSDKLVPITSTLFYIDRNSQVEFLRDDRGSFSKLRLLWNDGWVDVIERTTKK
jgi:retinol-binding protein 3